MAEVCYGFLYHGKSFFDNLAYEEGQTITLEANETAYLIHYDTATISISEWPGQLWFVEILDDLVAGLSKEDMETVPSKHFRLVKRLASSFLFGSQGEGVCQLLDKIKQLNLSEVTALADLFTPIGLEAYSQAWSNWLGKTNSPMELRDADHTGTLAIGSGDKASPIYSGFLVINELIHQKAFDLMGEEAFTYYSESDRLLSPLWNKACSLLLQSAMALGAESFVTNSDDLKLLLAGWTLLTRNE